MLDLRSVPPQPMIVSNGTSGYKGVSKRKGRWQAIIHEKGNQLHPGTFDCPEVAASIYVRVGFILN